MPFYLILFDFLCSLDFTGLLSESWSGLVIQVALCCSIIRFMYSCIAILPCVRINDDDDDDDCWWLFCLV